MRELKGLAADLDARSGRLSGLRGLTFLIAGLSAAARAFVALPPALWIVTGVFGAAFVGLVVAHAVLVTRSAEVAVRMGIVARSLKRLDHDTDGLADRGDRFASPEHPYANDLDVFGENSLFQLVSTAHTSAGEATLAAWLARGASVADISARQEAVRELSSLAAFREELELAALAAKGRPDRDPFVTWAEGGRKGERLAASALLRIGAALVATTLGLLLLGQVLPRETIGLARHLWIVTMALQVLLLAALRPTIGPLLAIVGSREEPFGKYHALVRVIEAQRFRAPLLEELRRELGGESGADASSALASLSRIIGFGEVRHSGLIHVLADVFLLWDVFVARALERWRDRHGERVGAWLRAIGTLEALSSLSGFAFANPAYAFPRVSDGPLRFEAEALGHPLLPPGKRVTNDVVLPRPGACLMVTGSNMSGKSTLLRSMGLNAVLALAGAPVCARELSLTPVSVRTSMRIKDSLREGISHFYAELGRLKGIVDAVSQGERVVFLLDEILHGTNSRERQIGAKAIVLHLLEKGAIGAVSSHDLGLAELESLREGVVNVHFEEAAANGKMTFDYQLKRGVVKSGNALRLMKMIGIDVPLPEA
jgi:hypothetical protein